MSLQVESSHDLKFSGIPPEVNEPQDGLSYVLGELSLPPMAIVDEHGFYTPAVLGPELAGKVLSLVEKFDQNGFRSPKELRKLSKGIDPYLRERLTTQSEESDLQSSFPVQMQEGVHEANPQQPHWSRRIHLARHRQPSTRYEPNSIFRRRHGTHWRGPGRYSGNKD